MTRAVVLVLVALVAWVCGVAVGVESQRAHHRCERPVTAGESRK